MPSEASIADYLDDGLPPEVRAAVEESLTANPELLREVVSQERIDAGLRAMLGTAEHETVKRGILADLEAGTVFSVKRRVLADTTAMQKRRRSHAQDWWIVFGSLAAAACVVLMIVFLRPRPSSSVIADRTPAPEDRPPRVEAPPPEVTPVIPKIAETKGNPAPEPPQQPVKPQQPMVAQTPAPLVAPPVTPPSKPQPQVSPVPAVSAQPPPALAALRNPAEQPFASKSPWNQSIGSGAAYAHLRFAKASAHEADKVGIRTRPVLRDASDGAPYRVIVEGAEKGSFHLNLPPDRLRDNDQIASIIDRDARNVLELRDADFAQPGVINAKFASLMDLRGSGFGGGAAESGCSGLGGTVRADELAGGIHHALAIAMEPQLLSGNGKDASGRAGNPFTWPATSAPFYAKKYFPKNGNVTLGSLLAIPPSVDLEKLNVGAKGTPGYELARALQDYGAYVVDLCKWQQFHFYFANNAKLPADLQDILTRLVKHLQVITNNTPATPGGGGRPRCEPAAELAK